MSECTHDCSTCKSDCSSRDLRVPANAKSSIKHVIAVVSGKGGVGKSTVTSLLAVAMRKLGYSVGILDADLTGPSIPQAFGLHEPAAGSDDGILPAVTKDGIKVMSVNLLLPDAADPVVWRGPVLAGAVKQFWSDVIWGDVDYLFVDLPPGTGDVPLTVFQSLPVNGVVIVTSPQALVSMIVEKAVNMAAMMKKNVVGLVENMSYYVCPDCGAKHEIFRPWRQLFPVWICDPPAMAWPDGTPGRIRRGVRLSGQVPRQFRPGHAACGPGLRPCSAPRARQG